MKQLSRFEANLLWLVHGILQRAPVEKVLPLALTRQARPPCLSRQAVELLQDTLAKGTVWLLAREGWRRERFLRGEQVAHGQLWQRTPALELGLTFSRHALDFLIWLTATDHEAKLPPPDVPAEQLAAGDHFLFLLTYRLFRGTEVGTALRVHEPIAANGMCRLLFPDDFAEVKQAPVPAWNFWTKGIGSVMLEALQVTLTKRWLDMEIAKRQVSNPARMLALGQSQTRTLSGFLESVNSVGRRDLARFLLPLFGTLLAGQPSAQQWIGGLKTDGLRLNQRVEMHRAALALVRQLEGLQQWDAEAHAVGYFDDGYAASQLWKADWEHHQGDELCRRAQIILQEVEPLQM